MYNLNPLTITAVPGSTTVTFAQDFDIEIGYKDAATGAMLLDHTGANKIKASALLPLIPSDQLADLLRQLTPSLVWQMAVDQGQVTA